MLQKNITWLNEFRLKHGRSPRVLHIGNIANNAYNNAKLLNEVGFDCDVICYDYYHIMGCPEWEDADFEGDIKDQFFPNWGSVNLKNFQRPKWFVQSSLKLCLYYLIAKRNNKQIEALLWWNILNIYRVLRCSPLIIEINKKLRETKEFIVRFILEINDFIISLGTISKFFAYGYKTFFYGCKTSINFLMFLFHLSIIPLGLIELILLKLIQSYDDYKVVTNEYSFDDRVAFLINKFANDFPDRLDKFSVEDLEMYRPLIFTWQNLFNQYDIIQAYSTDPILPLLADKPYFAFEHGTLREIPFQADPQGRRTALSYKMANHVFVTNADCLENAQQLASNRVSFINHPFDEHHGDKVKGWQELKQYLSNLLDAEFLFFFPTRHDWVAETGYADKANDVFLNAFCQLRQKGYKVGLICCQWGKNVQESIKLIEQHNCAKFVLWQEPMGTIKFERMAKACDIVVDQFKLGSFGGILFKAMAVGAPICTYLNEEQILKEYPAIPPVINCQTTDQLIHQLADIIGDSSKLELLSSASKQWIEKYHSSLPTIQTQIHQYHKFLGKN
jgi:hypothetical protein